VDVTELLRRSPGRGPPYWKSRVLRRQVSGEPARRGFIAQRPVEPYENDAGKLDNDVEVRGRDSLGGSAKLRLGVGGENANDGHSRRLTPR
jgi:hypothetical protein